MASAVEDVAATGDVKGDAPVGKELQENPAANPAVKSGIDADDESLLDSAAVAERVELERRADPEKDVTLRDVEAATGMFHEKLSLKDDNAEETTAAAAAAAKPATTPKKEDGVFKRLLKKVGLK